MGSKLLRVRLFSAFSIEAKRLSCEYYLMGFVKYTFKYKTRYLYKNEYINFKPTRIITLCINFSLILLTSINNPIFLLFRYQRMPRQPMRSKCRMYRHTRKLQLLVQTRLHWRSLQGMCWHWWMYRVGEALWKLCYLRKRFARIQLHMPARISSETWCEDCLRTGWCEYLVSQQLWLHQQRRMYRRTMFLPGRIWSIGICLCGHRWVSSR